ncbi:MAG: AAA family ATPase [Aestuariibacter sp.]|nr:AAA family ATPase [Aestuariibacter sp.]|tara:strand:- start:41427 stop:42389 length:963 start_codon:yes stop_codon:yes gene_type:complete
MTDLHKELRPSKLAEVIGQDAVATSLQKLKAENRLPHLFLFTGGSGIGKTTFARIIGSELLGVTPNNLIEVDAASNSKVEDVRALMAQVKKRGLVKGQKKMVIIDECHRLSGNAWDALLKDTEEPPEHLYIALCTTEVGKVPKTIKTRATDYHLKDLSIDDLIDVGELANSRLEADLDEKVLTRLARKAEGSARNMLTLVGKASTVESRDDLTDLLEDGAVAKPEFIKPMRYLCTSRSPTFKGAMELIVPLVQDGNTSESIRLATINYAAKMLRGSKTYSSEGKSGQLLALIDAFGVPMVGVDGEALLYKAVADFVYSAE